MGTLKQELKEKKITGCSRNNRPDIKKLEGVKEMTLEEFDKKAREAQETKHYVETIAEKLAIIRKNIAKFEQVSKNGLLSPADSRELEHLMALEKEFSNIKGEELKKHLVFSELIVEIRNAKPSVETAKKFVDQAVKDGRHKIASIAEAKEIHDKKRWLQGTIFFGGHIYLPAFKPEEKSEGQKAFESELVKYVMAVHKIEKKQEKAEIERIKNAGNPKLSLFKAGDPGKYLIYFSERDAGLISVEAMSIPINGSKGRRDIPIVKILEGAGSLRWMNDYTGKWIPFSWYKKNEVPDEAPDHLRDISQRIIKTIRAGIAAYYAKQR